MTLRPLRVLALPLSLFVLAACGQAADETEAGAPADAPAAESATQTPATTLPAPGALEVGFDRPGYDFESLRDREDAAACQAACEENERCVAFTWVEPGVQADTAICWLKDQVPGTVAGECCTSGVMPGRIETAPEEA